jgi:hypothetical protein
MRLDWSTAEVRGGKLTVALDDKPSREWCASFERTERILNHGTWPDVKLKKGTVVVGEIEPGSEENLRFFLESVVQEANAGQAPDEEAAEENADEQDEDIESEPEPDEEMTERFRSFGGSD